MPYPSMQSSSQRVRRVAITLPANASAAVTLQSLIEAAMEALEPGWTDKNLNKIMGGSISGNAAAYIVGDSTTSLPQTIAISTTYSEPAVNFLAATFAKAAADAAVPVVASVYLVGTDQ